MYLYFYKDGTYSADYDETREFYFGIEDISTHRKGPIFAFTNSLEFTKDDWIEMKINMNYTSPDVPFNAESTFTSFIKMNNPNTAYNAYPLIKQMIECNNFIEGQSQFVDSKIYISEILLNAKNKIYKINEESSDEYIDSIFEKLNIKTCMNRIVEPEYSIMMNDRGYWRKVKYNPSVSYGEYLKRMRWTRALICFPEMETAYNCRYKTLLELEKIKSVSVKVTYCPTPPEYNVGYFDSVDRKFSNEYVAIGTRDILRLCLFVPQIINIEQNLYNVDVIIEVNVVLENKDIKLTITEKESKFSVNTGIFNLIERMLTINAERRDVKENWFYENYKDREIEDRFKDWSKYD